MRVAAIAAVLRIVALAAAGCTTAPSGERLAASPATAPCAPGASTTAHDRGIAGAPWSGTPWTPAVESCSAPAKTAIERDIAELARAGDGAGDAACRGGR
jgi:hypothetical protein